MIQESIKNACHRVFDQLGYGHTEFVYQMALKYELDSMGIISSTERPVSIHYIDSLDNCHHLTSYRIDLYVFGQEYDVIIETKNITNITDKEINQVQRYLVELNKEGKTIPFGMILNFPKTNKGVEILIIDNKQLKE
jgi:GxxExxY protein